MLITQKIKAQFPIFKRKINGKPLTYLDNAATTQKPKCVIEALKNYYENYNANIHRGIHTLSEEATKAYENVRKKTAHFINAKSEKEIVFTKNSTESINLIAYSWGDKNVKKKDEILVSSLEHHSNLIPWIQLSERKEAMLHKIPLNDDYTVDMNAFEEMLSKKVKIIAITGMSNVLGTIPPLKIIIEKAHKIGAVVLVDGAQSAAHLKTNVQELDCDFFVFSSHKMLGPTGVGILYAKEEILQKMPPFLFGGEMTKSVQDCIASFAEIPWRFEAGTQNIADVIAFGKAIEFLENIGMENIQKHDKELLKYAREKFSKYPQVKLYGPKNLDEAGAVLSFTIEGVHAHDIASIFDQEGVEIRSGHHCAQPVIQLLKVPATARMSFYIYNTKKDIDRAEKALKKVIKTFKL